MPKQTLRTMLYNHGIESAALLEALEWKFKKIYTERDMAIRERDKLQERVDWFEGELAKADEWKAHNMALRTALKRIRSLAEKNVVKYAQQIADEALAKEAGQ